MAQVGNIRTEKRRGLTHTKIVSHFTYGFDHVLEYERQDAITRLVINIRFDGAEIYRKEASLTQTLGSESVPFTIEGAPVGLIKVTLLVVALVVKVSVAGTNVMTA